MFAVVLSSFGALWAGTAHAAPVETNHAGGQYQNVFVVGAGTLGGLAGKTTPAVPSSLAWSARYGFRPEPVVTWELAYLGATNMFAAGPGEGAVRTLVETDLKLDLIPISPLCPFVAAGVGYQVTTRPTIQDVGFVTPLAAGLDVNVDTVMVEARATARPTWWSPGSRSTWTAELALGSRF